MKLVFIVLIALTHQHHYFTHARNEKTGQKESALVLISLRASGASQVVDLVDLDQERLGDVVPDHLKVGVPDPMRDGRFRAGKVVVEHGDVVAHEHEPVDEVGADKACAAGDEDAFAVVWSEQFDGREGGGGEVVEGSTGRRGRRQG